MAAGQASGAAMSGGRGEGREKLPTLPVRRFRDRHDVFPARGYLRIPAAAFGLIWGRKSAAGRQKVAFQMRALPWTRIVKAVLTAAKGLISNPGFVGAASIVAIPTAVGASRSRFANVQTFGHLRLWRTARISNAACRRQDKSQTFGILGNIPPPLANPSAQTTLDDNHDDT